MGMFAFKRMREQEAARLVVSAPSKKKKTKLKPQCTHTIALDLDKKQTHFPVLTRAKPTPNSNAGTPHLSTRK